VNNAGIYRAAPPARDGRGHAHWSAWFAAPLNGMEAVGEQFNKWWIDHGFSPPENGP
jgi:hypothetical protein